jgi:hypothetical protein
MLLERPTRFPIFWSSHYNIGAYCGKLANEWDVPDYWDSFMKWIGAPKVRRKIASWNLNYFQQNLL